MEYTHGINNKREVTRIIGITGGIGSGKSTLCRYLSLAGYPVYDCDSRAKWLMNNDDSLRNEITLLFGSKAYSGGTLDKNYLASVVFRSEDMRLKLNNIVHPAVRRDIMAWADSQTVEICFVESAILFESRVNELCHLTANISAPAAERIERAARRDGVAEQTVSLRLESQMPDRKLEQLADITLQNPDGQPIEVIANRLLEFVKNH